MDAMNSYANLGPDDILNALDHVGYRCDGRILALNSYENRVYQVGMEDATPVIAKFYRPGRWPDDAILEEHAFTLALAEAELPVIARSAVTAKACSIPAPSVSPSIHGWAGAHRSWTIRSSLLSSAAASPACITSARSSRSATAARWT